jgi:hypothetical protein
MITKVNPELFTNNIQKFLRERERERERGAI